MTHRHIQLPAFALIIVAMLAVDASAQLGGGPGALYSRYFIMRCDQRLFDIDNALFRATLTDEVVKRALEASNNGIDQSQIALDHSNSLALMGQFGQGGARSCVLQFYCDDALTAEARRTVWNAILKELEKSLNKAQHDAATIQSKQTNKQLDRLEQKLREAEAELAAVRDRFVEIQVSAGTPVDQIRNVLQNMIDDRRQMEMKLIGLEAEREAISKRVEELLHASQKAGEEGEIIQEMKQILQLRMEALDRGMQMFKTANMSETEVGELREAVASAKVEFLRAREAQRAAAGGDEINDLNRHLAEMSRNVMMNKAMLEGMEKQRDELRAALEKGIRSTLEQNQVERELQLRSLMVQKLSEQRAQLEMQRGDDNITPVTLTPWGE